MRSRRFAFLAILLCTSAAARAFAAASLTPLGFLPDGYDSRATGVSADGSVVVGYNWNGSNFEAFRWTSDGGMVGLGILPGDLYSTAYGISADGSVVVGASGHGASGRQEAFRWTSGGGMVGLGILPGDLYSTAYGVSADGSVVVGRSGHNFSGRQEAIRWTSDGGMVGLGHLLGGEFESLALGVSADGSVIVGGSYSASGYEAFRWTSDGGMVGLGDLPGGWFSSDAYGVSADGSVIVGTGTSASGLEAFRWTSDGGMVGLGNLPGTIDSWAYGVSADGSVIVGLGISAGIQEAFRWTADGGMRKLWDELLSHGVDPAADGWTRLEYASGISHDGNTIVGYGTRNGTTEAFVAVIPTIVPEPAAGALALLGVSSILLLRRRSPGRPNKFSLSKVAAMLASSRRPRERSNPMRQLKLFRWVAVLTLAIALAPGAASAQEDGTITISSLFSMDYLNGTVGPDLAEVFANGHEHTWTLTLYGTSQSHETFTNPFGVTVYATEIHATSFDLEFFGPDAATLNGIVSDHIAGGDVSIYLTNEYSSGIGNDFSVMHVWPRGPDFDFASECDLFGCGTLFPTDADGYPVVGPDPFSIWNEYSVLVDTRPGNNGYIESRASLVTFVAVVPDPTGPPGDFNQDGIVDAADYVVWRKTGGSQSGYNDWRTHFGQTSGNGSVAGANATVPEPTTLVMLIVATVGIRLRRRHIASECRKLNSA